LKILCSFASYNGLMATVCCSSLHMRSF